MMFVRILLYLYMLLKKLRHRCINIYWKNKLMTISFTDSEK